MQALSEFQTYLRKRCKELNIDGCQLAKNSGVVKSAMHKIMNGNTTQPQLTTMVAMAHSLKIHPIHLFRQLLNQNELPNYTSTGAKNEGDATGFIEDVTYPDHSRVAVNQKFVKIWKIQNLGNHDWIGRKFICLDAPPKMDVNLPEGVEPPSTVVGLIPTSTIISMEHTPAGDCVEIAVEFTAPPYPCTVYSYWKMVDAEDQFCFPELQGLYCLVNVLAI
jgi:transcriptional regulator with XRE-family HTH domain